MSQPSNNDLTPLRKRWLTFIDRSAERAPAPELALATFDDLAGRYGDARRAYHNLTHLEQCFRELDAAADSGLHAQDRAAVELALWLHDAVYEPFSSKNEARSAELAVAVGAKLGLAPASVEAARRMILATKAHAVTADPDEQLVLDCDLSILGQEPVAFAAYQRDVRKEYRWVPDWYYARKRRAFLSAMQDRSVLFQTSYFHQRYEDQARESLRAAVRDLAPEERACLKVGFDDQAMWTTQAGALRDRLAWDRMERIIIKTTDRGPAEDDVIWILFGGDSGAIVGSEDEGAEALVEYLLKRPGMNYDAVISAMGSTTNQVFEVWSRGEGS